MDLITNHLLTILLFLPTAGAVAVLLATSRAAVRRTALGFTLATFLLSLALLVPFKWGLAGPYAYAQLDAAGNAVAGSGTVQMVERADWIPAFRVQYLLGVDGLSYPLVVLSTFIAVLACLASWNVERMAKGYFALFLFLQTGVLGVFLSLDLFLFYVFFEVSLLPMYFLIGVWGGPRKEYAAIKFFLYTLVGSIALLIALIGTFIYGRSVVPGGTFDLVRMAAPDFHKGLLAVISPQAAATFFVLLMVGFLIKVPAVPFHTWLPDAHVEAPTPISMILAAVLLKMGGYGIFRIAYPLYPEAAKHWWMAVAVVGVVSIVYGALCAMSQTDFKKLVAYSSVSHMGFVVLGAAMMTDAAANGALFMMVAHGITSAMMFFVVGVAYDRAHHRELSRLGGLATTMPLFTGLATIACFANLGLPGLCGFVAEVMVLLGAFGAARGDSILVGGGFATAGQIYPLAAVACLGVILSAAYMLWTVQRVFLGPEKPEHKGFAEVDRREVGILAPLATMAILLGVLPGVFVFAFTNNTVKGFFGLMRAGRVAPTAVAQPEARAAVEDVTIGNEPRATRH